MPKTRKPLPISQIFFGTAVLFALIALFIPESGTNFVKSPPAQNQTFFTETPAVDKTSPDFFIESLRKRKYTGGKITIEKVLLNNPNFTSYLFSYPSDNLKIVGVLNVPNGRGPYPIIILAHGYYNPKTFKVGTGTEREANFLVKNGYVTFAPNFRGFGASEDDGSAHLFRADFAIDVMELVASIEKSDLAFLDKKRIGMWGHSMGGGVSERVAVVTDKVKAYVLFGPVESDAWKDFNRFGSQRPEVRDAIVRELGSLEKNPDLWNNISPVNFVHYIVSPFQIHHGVGDATVPISSSEEFQEALIRQGKNSEFFRYENQAHFLRGDAWELSMRRILSFYNKFVRDS